MKWNLHRTLTQTKAWVRWLRPSTTTGKLDKKQSQAQTAMQNREPTQKKKQTTSKWQTWHDMPCTYYNTKKAKRKKNENKTNSLLQNWTHESRENQHAHEKWFFSKPFILLFPSYYLGWKENAPTKSSGQSCVLSFCCSYSIEDKQSN